jgi:hypothetical protein
MVGWVRAYLRRGATFSDRVILTRQELVEQIKAGKIFVIGQREEYKASTFQVSNRVILKSDEKTEWLDVSQAEDLVTKEKTDNLAGAPIL